MSSSEIGRILLVDHSRGALLFQETILRRRDMLIMTALAGPRVSRKHRPRTGRTSSSSGTTCST